MNRPIYINLVVEDILSELCLRKILFLFDDKYDIQNCYGKKGKDYIISKLNGFNHASRHKPFLVLIDLDMKECAPVFIRECINFKINQNFLFRIAVREVESWILANRKEFASFLGIPIKLLPGNPDEITDPKQTIVDLARRSRKRKIREAIVPNIRGTAKVGPDYNGRLGFFLKNIWNPEDAMRYSASLKRTFISLQNYSFT